MEAINLDILPGAMPPIVHVSQGDVGRQFQIAIYDETGSAYSLTGKTLSIIGHKGDGNVFQYAIPSSAVSGNTVTITTEEQMTPAAGKALCEIRIEQNGTKIGTCNFVMQVEQGPADLGSLSTSALYIIDALMQEARDASAEAEAAAETAEAAISTVTQKASEAASSATAAATSASNASTSASNAASSATAAAASATEAASVVEGVHDDAVAAQNAATAAATSASAASTSASAAATSATSASNYASAADTSADAASDYADAASQNATAAATSASNASSSATSAASSASDAANSASDAADSANDAADSASDAASSATAAAGSVNDASTYASNAAASATASANSATAAASSASDAEDAKDAIEDMTVSSQTVPYTSPAEVTKTISPQGIVNLDFKIPRGEPMSGHEVIANPSGAATGGDLTKLGIDGTNYNVSGLPDYSQASNGDVLTIGQSGPEWSAPSGGDGDVFAQVFFNRSANIANIYSDSLCTTKVYERENGTPFTFSANTDYYIETNIIQLAGQQMFLDPIQNYWLGYFAKADADRYNIANVYGVPLLEDFGNDATLTLLPNESTASIVGSNDLSGITGALNLAKQFIMPVKPADVNVNVVDDKITLKFYFMITPASSVTWTPTEYGVDFTISCTSGQLTMAGSTREL